MNKYEILDEALSYYHCDSLIPENSILEDAVLSAMTTYAEHLNRHDGWISIEDAFPKPLETVWLYNGKDFITIGCLAEFEGGWCWSRTNGDFYIENNEIVSECESDDLDNVKYWRKMPKLPQIKEKE